MIDFLPTIADRRVREEGANVPGREDHGNSRPARGAAILAETP
ncbi:hypothetical protein [Amycolatopsis nalaikhensis]|uniref:Uncharacterized protein n=1 Tax=Amycolatopsis nalaikhensis TaxID=715472 RepID=A0ABY8XE48_9PSEU|nr:hypothetical protein [Amycolatopsis sp. 2-2]WIV53879.1 hypothetical protein QP939_34060 [Amycolatopsis sp. 2-2]